MLNLAFYLNILYRSKQTPYESEILCFDNPECYSMDFLILIMIQVDYLRQVSDLYNAFYSTLPFRAIGWTRIMIEAPPS